VIRLATVDDVSALSELAKRTWADAFGHSVSAQDEAAELEEGRSESYFANALQGDVILIAERERELLAYVQFGDVRIPEIEVRAGDQELHRVYVDTELQGRGLGRRLSEAALQHPRLARARRIYLQVWEKNEHAVRLYESLGFRTVGTTTFTIGSEVAQDLIMRLEREV
jgi:diamine N-acetyltransferase